MAKIFGYKYKFYYLCNAKQKGTRMNKLKVREVIQLLKKEGWVEIKANHGDHRQFKHPTKKGKVTVRGKMSETLNDFLLLSIWRQAGWRKYFKRYGRGLNLSITLEYIRLLKVWKR